MVAVCSPQPFAMVPMSQVRSCRPILQVQACALFPKPLPSPQLDSWPGLNDLFEPQTTKRREQTDSNITPWLVDGGRQPAPR